MGRGLIDACPNQPEAAFEARPRRLSFLGSFSKEMRNRNCSTPVFAYCKLLASSMKIFGKAGTPGWLAILS